MSALALAVLTARIDQAAAWSAERAGRRSVVKIYVTVQRPDYSLPWQAMPPSGGTGTGFIIAKKRILTNAHLVANARFLQIQKDGDPTRYRASVGFVGHDCDLAVLTVENPDFLNQTAPLALAAGLPKLNDEVTVLGYPLGGVRLSVTKGVVSRLDYSRYAHSGVDQHLVLQVDAAINPGNSGGPILYGGKVAGLAFQGLNWAENIGYAIPLPVIRHFLDDIADGAYHGYPELGAATLDMRNPALRAALGMPKGQTGVGVYYLDPFGSAVQHLKVKDVLLEIDGHAIANDGSIAYDGNRSPFHEILERKQWGDSIAFKLWRDGREARVAMPLRNPPDPFVYRNVYDQRPEYLIVGGLVFSPLNREYLRSQNHNRENRNVRQLNYYTEYAKIDGLYKGRLAFIVLIRRLPHAVNAYMGDFVNGIVEEVNGMPVGHLSELKTALSFPKEGFHVFHFAGLDESLVLDAQTALRVGPEILERYGVPSPEHIEKAP
jgi:S1-C subfamily serine protease